MGYMAANLLRVFAATTEKREHRYWLITGLLGHERIVQGLAIDPRRRTGFQSCHAKRHFAQSICKRVRRWIAGPTAGFFGCANQYAATKKRADCQDNAWCMKFQAHAGNHASDAIALENHIFNGLLKNRQPWLVFQDAADRLTIKCAISLRACGANGRSFARI